jgi:hypothetical protein
MKYQIWTGKRFRRVYPCVRKGCKKFSSTQGEYCCVWCGRKEERHRFPFHTNDCLIRIEGIETVQKTN